MLLSGWSVAGKAVGPLTLIPADVGLPGQRLCFLASLLPRYVRAGCRSLDWMPKVRRHVGGKISELSRIESCNESVVTLWLTMLLLLQAVPGGTGKLATSLTPKLAKALCNSPTKHGA